MQLRTARCATASLAALIAGCGAVHVPPPQPPSREIPLVDPPNLPPEPGLTRILLDANGADARVTEVTERTEAWAFGSGYGHAVVETEKPVCIVPCSVDMKPGMHTLFFQSLTGDRKSRVDIQVGSRSKAVRHAMGLTTNSWGGQVLGFLLVTLGSTALATGGAIYASLDDIPEDKKSRSKSLKLAAAGGGAVLVSIPLLLLTRPTEQPGSSTEIPIAP